MPTRLSLLRQLVLLWLCGLMAVAVGAAPAAPAATASSAFYLKPADAAWVAALPLDAQAATQAFMDRIPPEVKARSDAYFEGGYWLRLWNWVLGMAIAALLLWTRPSTAWRDWAQARLQRPWLVNACYGAAYSVAGWVLSMPLALYQEFVREHQYGMATQTLGEWLGEQVVALGVGTVMMALLVAVLYAVLRRTGPRWWLWGSVVITALLVVLVAVSPVFIEPLFNTYKPVEAGPVKSQVLAMAQANGVPADNIYEFDASRQTTRVSANVSGLLGTAAIRLNDNLLRRATLPEIRAVMAHEIGHYTLNHVPKMLLQLGLIVTLGFALCHWAMSRLLARYGAAWRVTQVSDIASLPLLTAVFSTYVLLATPALNTLIRTAEIEADYFGLNTAREPVGMSEVLLKLVEYRKADPGPLEEMIFFDHPSARTRIHQAMRWREQMLASPVPAASAPM
ncbi:MAG: peptidase M48 [Ideonella sp. MAG2]|nr:MAG: peptidase M48 [Ideonella sp. MAG2]